MTQERYQIFSEEEKAKKLKYGLKYGCKQQKSFWKEKKAKMVNMLMSNIKIFQKIKAS